MNEQLIHAVSEVVVSDLSTAICSAAISLVGEDSFELLKVEQSILDTLIEFLTLGQKIDRVLPITELYSASARDYFGVTSDQPSHRVVA
jgi:hypothetical protein